MISGFTLSDQGPRELFFGEQIWRIKSPRGRSAPGPNYWSNTPESVWVDEQGMHLKLARREERWYASEVFTRFPLGYGTYTFTIDCDFSAFTPDVVAGFFTWDTRPEEHNRELDIEFSAWGTDGTVTGQYVVQPVTGPDRIYRFDPMLEGSFTTHRIEWFPDEISFTSYHGHVDPDSQTGQNSLMETWIFPGTPPTEGTARFRFNLWLFRGRTDRAEETQLTVSSFRFDPWEP